MELIVSVGHLKEADNLSLDIYDMSGGRIYRSVIMSGKTTIRNVFTRGKVYIIRVGNINKKVVF